MSNQEQLKDNSLTSADYRKFMVRSRVEIAYILRAIQQKNELVTAYFNQGNDFILTSILHVDPDKGCLILDYGASETLNKRVVESNKIILVTALERVKVQFATDSMERTQHLGRDAFRLKFPAELLKLQRREYYRLATPVVNPVKCVIPREDGGSAEMAISDLSLGGIAIIENQTDFKLETGNTFPGCKVVLPDIGTIVVAIQIRSVAEITLKNGSKSRRIGCQFLDVSAGSQAMIQRYIIKLDRERRARLAGE